MYIYIYIERERERCTHTYVCICIYLQFDDALAPSGSIPSGYRGRLLWRERERGGREKES